MKRRVAGSSARAIALGASLLLGGCSLVPEYHRPEPAMPSAWNTEAPAGDAKAVGVHGGWWRDFGSEELTALVDRSLTGNYSLQAAVARVDEARGSAEVAGAPLYPSVTLNVTGDATQPLASSKPAGLFLQASYELDFWGKNRALAHSAQELAQATDFDRETVALTLTASVTETYFQVLSLQDRVRLAQRIADSARRTLSLLEAQASEGVASDLQVQQQRNVVATFDAAVPALRQQLEQNVHRLAVLVGGIPEGFTLGGQSLEGLSIPRVQTELPATLLTRRPDIQSAEARLISAHFDVGAARAALYPNIALTAQGGVVSGALTHFFPAAPLLDIAGSLVQPLFEGGRLRGQLKVERARAVELAATYRQTVVSALQDVEDALTSVARLEELETIDVAAVDSARRASELADARYRLGATDFLTVLTTERTLYQAEDALLQVRLQRLEGAVGLFRALGGGFEPPPALSRN